MLHSDRERPSLLSSLWCCSVMRFGISLLILLFALVLVPLQSLAAEVLQVRSSTLLQVGDRNRNYSVRLACVEVDPANEVEAVELLKKAVPRRKRVNLRPEGNEMGTLIARVTPIGEDQDLGVSLVATGLARSSCDQS